MVLKQSEDFNKFATRHMGVNSMCLHDYKKATDKIVGFNATGAMMIPKNMTPNIIEERQMNAVLLSVFDRLMMDRIIFIGINIDSIVANVVNAQLLFLESVDPNKEISIYFNTSGGEIYAGMGIYDLMQYIKPDVATVCTGLAASMGAVLLCAGTKGKRSALKHSRIMIHQPSYGNQGTVSDMEISLKESLKIKKELYEIISLHSGQSLKKVEKDSDRDCWLTSYESREYGIIDSVLEGRKK